jgi:NADH dehydrogenase
VPPWAALWATHAAGLVLRDVVLTREEIQGLMADLLHVDAAPTGATRLTDWARQHRGELGRHYASELARRRAPAM